MNHTAEYVPAEAIRSEAVARPRRLQTFGYILSKRIVRRYNIRQESRPHHQGECYRSQDSREFDACESAGTDRVPF
jgi:hypothetical protein